MIKTTPLIVRAWLHPLLFLFLFTVAVLMTAFVQGEIDPLKWEKSARGGMMLLLFFALPFVGMLLEFSNVPKEIAETINHFKG